MPGTPLADLRKLHTGPTGTSVACRRPCTGYGSAFERGELRVPLLLNPHTRGPGALPDPPADVPEPVFYCLFP